MAVHFILNVGKLVKLVEFVLFKAKLAMYVMFFMVKHGGINRDNLSSLKISYSCGQIVFKLTSSVNHCPPTLTQ